MNAQAGIGPNAITRVAEALGADRAWGVFERAGLLEYLRQPPTQLVDEQEVLTLHQALRAELGPVESSRIATMAGQKTAQYLLTHRIPSWAQQVLKALPAAWSARLFIRAITAHAWTFAGTGEFKGHVMEPHNRTALDGLDGATRTPRPQVVLRLMHNPLCRGVHSDLPRCDYFAAVFEVLFRTLVHPQCRVIEAACEACGDAACVFEVRWRDISPT